MRPFPNELKKAAGELALARKEYAASLVLDNAEGIIAQEIASIHMGEARQAFDKELKAYMDACRGR